MPERETRLPVAIVTGFLGSGKTTLVNHILAQPHALRIAVMVNEIGDIAIDGELIARTAAGMIELANGCICCSINNDLLDAANRVLQYQPPVDYLVVETSGVADPLPIALTFLRPELRQSMRVDAIVAVADAESFSLDHFDSRAAIAQLRYADVVLLNKCDRVGDAAAMAVEQRIRAVGSARVVRTIHAQIPLALILGTGAFEPGRNKAFGEPGHDHLAGDGFEAVSFASDRAFSAERFQGFLEGLGANLFRAKGILSIEGNAMHHVFHLVGRRFTLDPAPNTAPRGSRLVLIGRNLDACGLRAGLTACLAQDRAPAHPPIAAAQE
ncbi:MAG: CobW family GTP-binding protein [Stellaceae bacterium]